MTAPLLVLDQLAQGLHARARRAPADLHARGRLRDRRAGDRRRDGPERRRQDHAVRADHRLATRRRRARAVSRAPTSIGCVPRARPARDPLPPVLPGARIPQAGAVVHARAVADRDARWCICSTSRSSTPRTAISASCSISSASCARRAGWCSSVPAPDGGLASGNPGRDRRAVSAGRRWRRHAAAGLSRRLSASRASAPISGRK